MKKYLIIAGIIICLIFIGWRILAYGRSSGTKNNINRLDKVNPAQLPTGDKVLVPGPLGDVETNNFIRGAPEVTSDRVGIIEDTSSGITYSPSDQTFYITISAENSAEFQQQRQAIEEQLLNKLGVSKEQACQLKVVERTLPSPDLSISDQQYPLSFCK